MDKLISCIYGDEASKLLKGIRENSKKELKSWRNYNFTLPLLFYLSPLLVILIFNIEEHYSVIQILNNGSLPLISIMLLASTTDIPKTVASIHQNNLNNINEFNKWGAIVLGLIAVLFYVSESSLDSLFLGSILPYVILFFCILILLSSFFLAFISNLTHKKRVADYAQKEKKDKKSRNVTNTGQIAK